MSFERNEYPRPQFRRDEWLPLNGEWEFELDDENDGEKRGLPTGRVALNRKNQRSLFLSVRRERDKRRRISRNGMVSPYFFCRGGVCEKKGAALF